MRHALTIVSDDPAVELAARALAAALANPTALCVFAVATALELLRRLPAAARRGGGGGGGALGAAAVGGNGWPAIDTVLAWYARRELRVPVLAALALLSWLIVGQ